MSENDTGSYYNGGGALYTDHASSFVNHMIEPTSTSTASQTVPVKTDRETAPTQDVAVRADETNEADCESVFCKCGLPCSECSKVITSQELEAVIFSCKFCTFTTDDFDGYNVHNWRHLPSKHYICNFCTFTTSEDAVIERHIAEHGFICISAYSCNVCGFKTVDEQDTTKHLAECP